MIYSVFIGLFCADLILWCHSVCCQLFMNIRSKKNFQEKKIQGGISYLRIFKGIHISLHVIAGSIAFCVLLDNSIECYQFIELFFFRLVRTRGRVRLIVKAPYACSIATVVSNWSKRIKGCGWFVSP